MNRENLLIELAKILSVDGRVGVDKYAKTVELIDTYISINNGKPVVSGSLPPDAQAFLVFDTDKVNSILSICLRCLDTNGLEVLRDCLIARTPPAAMTV
jgi:hypothetical protein